MIIFLYGTDSFRARQQLARMKEKFLSERDPQGLNVDVFQASTASDDEILLRISSSPFLAEKRMVVLDGVLSTKKADLATEITAMIREKHIPSFTVLVCIDEIDKPKGKEMKMLFDVLVAGPYAQQFSFLTGSSLSGWIGAEVQERGGSISAPAVRAIRAASPDNMWQIHHLINQLIAYRQEDVIQEEDVSLFIERPVDDNIFSLVDAIVKKQGKDVFQLIQKQYAEGKDPGYIFAMLLRQFRIMLQIADMQLKDQGLSPANTATALAVHPFVIKKTLPLLRLYSYKQLRNIHQQLLVMDTQVKTGQLEYQVAIDQFVGAACLKT